MKRKILALFFVGVFSFVLMSCHSGLIIHWKPVKVQSVSKPVLKVYLENSGSMDGYMCAGSQFKDAIYSYLSDLNDYTAKTDLNYINSEIIPYKKNSLSAFIRDLTPDNFKEAGGKRNSSDIADMLGRILDNSNDHTVSMFISDCILDIAGENAQNELVNREIGIKTTIVDHLKKNPNIGFMIIRLSSSFRGWYYYTDSHEYISEQRPYYIWLFGNAQELAYLRQNSPLEQIKHGILSYYAYVPEMPCPFELTNSYGTNLNGSVECQNSVNGNYTILLNVDLRPTLASEKEISDMSNWSSSNNSVKIEKITKISNDKLYTHCVMLSVPGNIRQEDCAIFFKARNIPNWLSGANDATGKNVKQHLSQTTGIKYIIGGIADAYKKQEVTTSFKFNINH